MKRFFLFFGAVFLHILNAGEQAPASIHLKLDKDTLALAEPILLIEEITNNQDSLVFVNLRFSNPPDGFQLYIVNTEGKEWSYRGGYSHAHPVPQVKSIYPLSAGGTLTYYQFLWWTPYLPVKYQDTLENIPAGTYTLFAKYSIRYKSEEINQCFVYSDTAEFVFLPLDSANLPVLSELNELKGGFRSLFGPEDKPAYQRIKESNTPYNEGAWIRLISWMDDYDELEAEKQAFDSRYPNSQFSPYIAECEFMVYLHSSIKSTKPNLGETIYQPEVDLKADSLLDVWSSLTPRSIRMLRFKEPDKFLSSTEFTERYYPELLNNRNRKKGCLFR